MTIRILTWNLQGRERPDLGAVADEIRRQRADVVALQEIQRRQASTLADLLGWHAEWRFKHWPIVVPAEGLAFLRPTGPTVMRTVRLAGGLQFWSWRRRIAVATTTPRGDGVLTLVNVHLGAGVSESERLRQARRTTAIIGTASGVIAGDLNTHPGSMVLEGYTSAGFRDAWDDAHPDLPGPTNWPAGPRTGPATQRLDYVLVSPGLRTVSAELPTPDDAGFTRLRALSDHLPLLVEVDAAI